MSSNPYDLNPWWTTAGAGANGSGGAANVGNVYDTILRTTTNAPSAARIAQTVTAAAAAAANGARAAAHVNASKDVIAQAGRVAAQREWQRITDKALALEYSRYEPSIFDQAASMLNPVTTIGTPVIDNASVVASAALKSAGGFGIGALFGGAGTAVILGAGALILLVLLKR